MSSYTIEAIGNYVQGVNGAQTVTFGDFETSSEIMGDLKDHLETGYALLDRDDI
jgi:hypothetical protein